MNIVGSRSAEVLSKWCDSIVQYVRTKVVSRFTKLFREMYTDF